MLAFVTEFIGTFIFLSAVLVASTYNPVSIRPIIVVTALLAMIWFGMHSSGGHFNPAISTMMMVKGDLTIERFAGYIVAQILGGLIALLWFQQSSKAGMQAQ